MFAYIDPTIRARLIDSGKLIRINRTGSIMGPEQAPEEGEVALNVLGPIPMPVDVAESEVVFDWYAFVRHTELAKANEIAGALRGRGEQQLFSVLADAMSVNSVLRLEGSDPSVPPLVRVHSCCLTGDVLGSKRCECGPQLRTAFERIKAHPGGGMVIYMSGHEGRGIGLWAKAVTYVLQDSGENTYQANRSLGLPDDSRDFSDAAAVLQYFLKGDRPFRLMSNNPKKLADLTTGGLTHIERDKHVAGVNPYNRRYLAAKREWGHKLDDSEIEGPTEKPVKP